ncbi:SHOCT domain-containing protein [Streptomyces sp. ACA25]|uniref:SHOCT domain-containing protein n=1 Tax=Streptomyces sp. ACA25 TaxID=3022596 RepID=UPI002307E343|nr:SHOCT domain-containing protein [Streptomyces sp. ACA25]MDB1086128.1 SHOCT domain-containing protein [Streptomyces sp. ACA25]
MHRYEHGMMTGWGWLGMSVSMLLFAGLILVAGLLLHRTLTRGLDRRLAAVPAVPSPEQLVADRFARGEIEEEEYRRRLTALRTPG